MDIATEMVNNLVPIYLTNVLGVGTAVVGLIEGVAEATASLLKLVSGWLSDRLGTRKWLAVSGYGLSAVSKALFLAAGSWPAIAGARWADRVGKGIRTAPRDALIADSVTPAQRGVAFGLQRAMDTAGAMVGLLVAWSVVKLMQGGALQLTANTFRTLVLVSLVPAALAVVALVYGAVEVPVTGDASLPKVSIRGLGRPFAILLFITALFGLGNSSDAFLTLRAQERGLSLLGILAMLAVFNLVYALISTPAGRLSDRLGRRRLIILGWSVYAAIYLGFGLAQTAWQVVVLYVLYGLYYGLAYGTTRALVADVVPESLWGTAYGTYNAVVGIMDLPASLLAGILWQGIGGWHGFGPQAPFLFGAGMALLASVLMWAWRPPRVGQAGV